MNILVVGGSGFVGHAIVRSLMSQGHSLTLLNRGNRPITGTTQLSADRNDPCALSTILDGLAFDAVVDTNCYTGIQARNLISALRGKTPISLVISSAAVYRDDALHPPSEDSPIGGGSAWGEYGKDKTEVEATYKNGDFFACVVFRPPYIYGPNNNLDRETWFFRRIIAGHPILVPGQGTAEYNFLHEDDLGAAICLWLTQCPAGFEVFNIADSQLVTAAQLPKMLAEAACFPVDIRLVGNVIGSLNPREWYPFRDIHCAADPKRFSEKFHWHPSASLSEYFKQIYLELSANGSISTNDWSPIENEIFSRLT